MVSRTRSAVIARRSWSHERGELVGVLAPA
ncbi:hypothetical protein M877_05775 [Streptomyces niveus NCIMB 11891]|nr:hypothetical protein M877_05775 [Streptomyces niveus NCIMB 11891]